MLEPTLAKHQFPCGAYMGRLHSFDHWGVYSGGDRRGATWRRAATGRALQDTRFAKAQIPL
jgi:hypothetical protein